MKLTNRENIQRAIGIIEGVSYVAAERVQDACGYRVAPKKEKIGNKNRQYIVADTEV